jgi:hypothetical protein
MSVIAMTPEELDRLPPAQRANMIQVVGFPMLFTEYKSNT